MSQQETGHKQKSSSKNQITHNVEEEAKNEPGDTYTMFHLPGPKGVSLLIATIQANNAELHMEIDTGASASISSNKTYKKLWHAIKRPQLTPTDHKLHIYMKRN